MGTLSRALARVALSGAWVVHAVAADPPLWNVDYAKSRIEFVAEQAGAKFRGAFPEFTAEVRFAPDALEASSARVVIATGAIDTRNSERDGYLKGPGWFEADAFPNAVFEAHEFEALGKDRYRAAGQLTVGDKTVPVPFEFAITRQGAGLRLTGSAELDRLVLGLGLGDWADTELIGQIVDVDVELVTRGR